MAFDRSSRYSAADAVVDVYAELGRAYVEPGTENIELAVLDDARAETLRGWADTLIPCDGIWPSGSAVPVVGYVDRTLELAPKLRPRVFEALDQARLHAQRANQEFASAGFADRVAVLNVIEDREPLLFTLLKELTYEVYYRDPAVLELVRERTAFQPRRPLDGVSLPGFDEALYLLADVAERPSLLRQVEP